jgi:hypothetical protein
MRKSLIVSLLGVALVAAIPTAASAARADTYFEVWCTDADGNVTQAETVDAHAVQFDKTPGGKDDAVQRFNENTPFGLTCVLVGPFTP